MRDASLSVNFLIVVMDFKKLHNYKDKFFQYSYQLLAPVTNKEYFLRLQ